MGKKGYGGREPVQRWFFGADPICVVGKPAVPFAGRLNLLTDTSRTHQQCWGRNSQASAESSQSAGGTRTNRRYTASSMFYGGPTDGPQLKAKANEPLHACHPRVLHKSALAFHLCLLQQNTIQHNWLSKGPLSSHFTVAVAVTWSSVLRSQPMCCPLSRELATFEDVVVLYYIFCSLKELY